MFTTQSLKVLTEESILSAEFNSYYFDKLGVKTIHDLRMKGKSMRCAIIDTGCDINHPSLKSRIIGCKNFTNEGDENDVTDYSGHGTHVAGLIAGSPHGAFKGGVAPSSKLVICKVLDKRGIGSLENVLNGIRYAIDKNVDVINLSLSLYSDESELKTIIKEAYDKGIVVCCAGGNAAKGDLGEVDEFGYPGAYQECINIGAINEQCLPSSFSNSNDMIDCVCYGEKILSTYKDGNYALLDGTSQASPLVAGCVLLIKEWFKREFGRKANKDEVYAALIKCSRNIKGYDRKQIGFGYIDLSKLVD